MLVSQYVAGVSPEFSITFDGSRTVTLTFHYDLASFFNEEAGVYVWDGEIGSQVGPHEGYVHQTTDRPMDLAYNAPLTPEAKYEGSYYLSDANDGTTLSKEFTVTVLSATSQYVGTSKADYVFGSGSTDTFHFVGEGDIFAGGLGNDFYFVDHASDTIIELGGNNDTDYVRAGVSYQLGAGVSVSYLTTDSAKSTSSLNLTGNELTQIIVGNYGDNVLKSNGGSDTLRGNLGNDTYIVRSGDTVIEYSNAGTDRVKAEESFQLKNFSIEYLTTANSTATTKIDLTGNQLSQEIIGNYGENVLRDGGGAADHLRGLAGNDTYQIYSSGTTIVESAAQGTADRVMAAVDYGLGAGVHIELLTTNGSTGTTEIDLAGNEFGQQIVGNAASNIIDGKGGIDTLRGLAGADFFAFSSALAADNVDVIVDFSAADDTIYLDVAIFAALSTVGALAATAFKDIADGPKDADDRVIYNSTTGNLYYDADGSAGAYGNVKFASISNLADLTAADFVVI